MRVNKLYHCSYSLSYHFVFVTKHRRKCFTGAMLGRLKEVVANLCEDWQADLIEMSHHCPSSGSTSNSKPGPMTLPADASSVRRFTTTQAGRLRLWAAVPASPLWMEHYGAIR